MSTKSITITYLSKVSFASLNGADKEVDNINPIKKVTLSTGEELPYISSQAIRRALRDRLRDLGWKLSNPIAPKTEKGATTTNGNPKDFIDDDLFGFMLAEEGIGNTKIRTSPVRVESLLALSVYKGDLDFATNYMGKGLINKKGEEVQPNIFETEIHSGIYRGSILIELDRIGCGEGFEDKQLADKDKQLADKDKCNRVLAFIDAFQNLWSSGRQSRFLADISPKFIAAAYMKAKNPIFLEAVEVDENNQVKVDILQSVITDYEKFIEDSIFASQEAVFGSYENVVNLKTGFEKIRSWVNAYYNVSK